jgi:hypothetical protein
MPFKPTAEYLDHIFASEESLCHIYPLCIQQLDKQYWSPLVVIYKAMLFLGEKKGAKILDIGSGSGKFCVSACYYKPSSFLFGVEQRQFLAEQSLCAKEKLGRLDVNFYHKNFTQLDLKEYDGFYFYNSFYENLPGAEKIDETIAYSPELYKYYNGYLNRQLDGMRAGTRIVTYCSLGDEIPPSYQLISAAIDGLLRFWIRK